HRGRPGELDPRRRPRRPLRARPPALGRPRLDPPRRRAAGLCAAAVAGAISLRERPARTRARAAGGDAARRGGGVGGAGNDPLEEISLNPRIDPASIRPEHFGWRIDGRVAVVTLDRPERRNPLTFDSYRELADTFHRLRHVREVRAVVVTGAGGNFCSGGDVHEIIGPLVRWKEQGRMDELLAFTRLTGDLVKTMRACPQPIVAAIDGTCAGAGAILAMASDLRYGTPR